MKRALLLALVSAACSKPTLPSIDSFSVDNPTPEEGVPVTFSFAVSGATRGLRIDPVPGPVDQSPVTVIPPYSTVFTLRASNESGTASRGLPINVVPVSFAIDATDAVPGQVAPGEAVTLSWSAPRASRATLSDGTGAAADVSIVGSQIVHPAATTAYVLTAYNQPGRNPGMVTAPITARVLAPPSVADFVARPAAIAQGEASTLSWTGNATSYKVTSDQGEEFLVGPRRSLVVRPPATTTYTLQAEGPAGGKLVTPPTATVTVSAHPGSTLEYTPPPAGALQLVADVCPSPCTSMTLRIMAAATVQLRGVALDLPLDSTKARFDSGSFASSLSSAVSQAAVGSGPLQDAVVVGLALEGDGSAPAQDVTLNPGDELAHFSLTLLPAGGPGVVFDGSALAAAPGSAYKASVQSAAGRATNAIAIGTLEAR